MSDEQRKPLPKHELRQGEGSFYFRNSDQRWIGVVDLGRDETGKRKRIIVSDRDEDSAWDKFQAKRREVFAGLQESGRNSAEEVIGAARSFGQNPVRALVQAGYLYESETRGLDVE
ncbi:hypothetical protein U6G28_03390 [Actinomycetaceae bacterium MB13-C1-2]|nr:hypothetical protein U6G28_03390 [Actinomycetaceae bacterium MB13-C1-2]